MAGLAYLLLPITGTIAYFGASSPRTRFHALQAVILGVVWPACLYVAALFSPGVTQSVYLAGAVVWIGFLLGAAIGRDPRLPFVGAVLQRWARTPPRS